MQILLLGVYLNNHIIYNGQLVSKSFCNTEMNTVFLSNQVERCVKASRQLLFCYQRFLPFTMAFHSMAKANLNKSQELVTNMNSASKYIKFIYSEKATKFREIFTLLLTVCTVVKSKVKISQNFVAFSEYMNFTNTLPRSFWREEKIEMSLSDQPW